MKTSTNALKYLITILILLENRPDYIKKIFIVYLNNFYDALILPTNYNAALKEEAASAELSPEQMGGHYQGDMIFPEDVSRGAAHRPSSQRWPNGIIPYDMTSSIFVNHSLLIVDAMRRMENLTRVGNRSCIQFRPKTSNDAIFITIQNGTGCSAYVGYLQNITLNRTVTLMHTPTSTCMITGIIQHELLHVLGFFHEQSRPDRDDYVSIQWNNILTGTEFNFEKYTKEDIDTLRTSYEYGSVMHYQANAFSANGLNTIIPTKDPNAVLGQRIGMSPIDILEVQRYYGCVPIPSAAVHQQNTISMSSTISMGIVLILLLH
ncbi:unnamed protein product [Rotaria socialis]|uniref:Metalloendopeptidase n=1 Tax=Rotaria socialis TaxID=392032 RepID=A0A818FIP8_9BILA|nr:unnamed protein product [Rotaria socialis]CAF3485702.1 unnamed protein product [Rotaria socialis]